MFDTTNQVSSASAEVARLRTGIAEMAGDDLNDRHTDEVSERLVGLLEIAERLDAEVTRVAAEWTRRRGWEADASLSPTAWLAHRAPVAKTEARRLVKAAKVVNASPPLAAALATGTTTSPHIYALAAVMSPRRQKLLPEHGELLAKQAERLPLKDFALLARRWASIADDQLNGDSHEPEPPGNEVKAAVTLDGRVDGTFSLEPISGAQLLGVLDHLAPPDPVDAPDGPRSLSERRGDALAELATTLHEGGEPGSNPPNLDVLVDVATATGMQPELALARRDLEGIGPITSEALDQLCCGATVRRVLMAGESIVLDMGRKARFATPSQARAIRIRDGGCIFPSCDRPPAWCDIHHIDGWLNGGNTDVARMCCLCRRHHTLIHNSQWTIVVQPDGSFRVTHPIRAP